MKTITIHLHNGEQLLLVELPIGASNMRNIKLESGNDAIVLGTWIPRTDVIDFEVQEEWVKKLIAFEKKRFEAGHYDVEFSKESVFLSLLKSEARKVRTLEEMPEKFIVLKIEKK